MHKTLSLIISTARKQKLLSQALHMSVILALRRLRQEDSEFQASLSYVAISNPA
jgi:hypothetical protein